MSRTQLRANCMRLNPEPPFNIEIYNQIDGEYIDAESFSKTSLENCKKVLNALETNRKRILRQHIEGTHCVYKRIFQTYIDFVFGHGRVKVELNITENGSLPVAQGGLPTVAEKPLTRPKNEDGGPVRVRQQRRQQRRTQQVQRERRATRRPQLIESHLYQDLL